jgi:hypothetical protein
LLERLEDEADAIERDGYTIEGMVAVEVLAFENRIKRTMDITNINMPLEAISFRGLQSDKGKRFGKNRIFMNRYVCNCSPSSRKYLSNEWTGMIFVGYSFLIWTKSGNW